MTAVFRPRFEAVCNAGRMRAEFIPEATTVLIWCLTSSSDQLAWPPMIRAAAGSNLESQPGIRLRRRDVGGDPGDDVFGEFCGM